jgi:hypothetical protein
MKGADIVHFVSALIWQNEVDPTSEDPLPPITTVNLRVAQFIARQKPFVADINVPKAVACQKILLTFNLQSEMKKRSFEDQASISRFCSLLLS